MRASYQKPSRLVLPQQPVPPSFQADHQFAANLLHIVGVCDNRIGTVETIGEENQMQTCFRVAERNTAQPLRVALLGFPGDQQDGLVRAQPGMAVYLARSYPRIAQVVLGSHDEAALPLRQRKESGEIQVAPVDNYDAPGWQRHGIEQVDVVHLAGGDGHEDRDRAAQIDDGVRFDSRLGGAEIGPREQGKTQVDGGRIHRVERGLEPQADVFVPIEVESDGDQPLPERLEQTPVAPLVGVGQRRLGNTGADADVIKLGTLGVEAGDQIAQPLSSGQLRVGHAQKMAPCRELADTAIRLEAIDQMLEVTEGNKLQQLREYGSATIHLTASPAKKNGNDTARKWKAISNRRNSESR